MPLLVGYACMFALRMNLLSIYGVMLQTHKLVSKDAAKSSITPQDFRPVM